MILIYFAAMRQVMISLNKLSQPVHVWNTEELALPIIFLVMVQASIN